MLEKSFSNCKAATLPENIITPAKCWYSECQQALSELEIDHFRPKAQIAGSKHQGYWWLAFNWQNFRIASSLANKRREDYRTGKVSGKGFYFPLLNEKKRVPDKRPIKINELSSRESPMLLDPLVAADVLLLDYSADDGKVVETYSERQNKLKHRRAKITIDLYHLDEGTLISKRAELGAAIHSLSQRIEALYRKEKKRGRLTKTDELDRVNLSDQLAQKINATAEFSAFARACLRQMPNWGWNIQMLSRC